MVLMMTHTITQCWADLPWERDLTMSEYVEQLQALERALHEQDARQKDTASSPQ
jgi:hypothetical protein